VNRAIKKDLILKKKIFEEHDCTAPHVSESYVVKGGMNDPVSGIKKRPVPPKKLL